MIPPRDIPTAYIGLPGYLNLTWFKISSKSSILQAEYVRGVWEKMKKY